MIHDKSKLGMKGILYYEYNSVKTFINICIPNNMTYINFEISFYIYTYTHKLLHMRESEVFVCI